MFFKSKKKKNKSKANFYTREGKKKKNALTDSELSFIMSQFSLNNKNDINILGYVDRYN